MPVLNAKLRSAQLPSSSATDEGPSPTRSTVPPSTSASFSPATYPNLATEGWILPNGRIYGNGPVGNSSGNSGNSTATTGYEDSFPCTEGIAFPLATTLTMNNCVSQIPSPDSRQSSDGWTTQPTSRPDSLCVPTKTFVGPKRTFSSGSSSSCCGPCSVLYPDVLIMHWPVVRTNTWCDSIKSDLSKSPLSTLPLASIAEDKAGAHTITNALAGYTTLQTNDFQKDQLTQGPAILVESVDGWGSVVKASTVSIDGKDSHVTRPPTNGSYSIDENGFVLYVPSNLGSH